MSRIQLNSFPAATKIFTPIWQLPESHFHTTLLEHGGRQIGLKGTRRGLKCFVPKRRQKGGSMNNYPHHSPLTDVFLVPVSSRINTACSFLLPLSFLVPSCPPLFLTRQTAWGNNKTIIHGAATILAKVRDDRVSSLTKISVSSCSIWSRTLEDWNISAKYSKYNSRLRFAVS